MAREWGTVWDEVNNPMPEGLRRGTCEREWGSRAKRTEVGAHQ